MTTFLDEISKALTKLASIVGLLSKILAVLGLCVVLWYCIRIGFHPTGLSAGDATIFLLTVLALAFCYTVSLILTIFCIFWLTRLFYFAITSLAPPAIHRFEETPLHPQRKRYLIKAIPKREFRIRREFKHWLYSAISFLLFVVFALFLFELHKRNPIKFSYVAEALYAFSLSSFGFITFACFEFAKDKGLEGRQDEEKKPEHQKQYSLLITMLMLLPFISGAGNFLVETTMKMIGVRFERTPAQLSEENFAKLKQSLDAFGIPVSTCKTENENTIIVSEIDTLWSGIGEVAYVRIYKNGKYADIKLDDSGYSPITTNSALVCKSSKRQDLLN